MKPDLMQLDRQFGSGAELGRLDSILTKPSTDRSGINFDNLSCQLELGKSQNPPRQLPTAELDIFVGANHVDQESQSQVMPSEQDPGAFLALPTTSPLQMAFNNAERLHRFCSFNGSSND